MTRRFGGKAQHGWMILEWPGVLLEAQFHAVWRRSDGTLVDVSLNDDERILFLPDRVRVYSGARIPSLQHPLSTASEVANFIAACRELFRYEALHWIENGSESGLAFPSWFETAVHFHLERCRVITQLQLYAHLGLYPKTT
jgi:hypothetical protein